MQINPVEFQKSVNSELKVIQDRVRNLIGDANWGVEGSYKEAVLKNVIGRFLGVDISLGTGFILKKEGRNEIERSKQIDIILYDNSYPVIFKEGDFVITTPENVRGIIEVKTSLEPSKVEDVISTATSNGKLMDDIKTFAFNGIFVYNNGNIVDGEELDNRLETALKDSKGGVDHICLGEKFFIKFWPQRWGSSFHSPTQYYSVYEIKELSFAYFISNLIDGTSNKVMEERSWFLYPLEGGKEAYKIKDIPV